MAKRALITGIGGQDGSLLAEFLLARGYEVAGITRRPPSVYPNLKGLVGRAEFMTANLRVPASLKRVLRAFRPQEVYNLASPSFVPRSWEQPISTAQFAAVGVTSLLEAVRAVDQDIRFYQASSSEIFGDPEETPQRETTSLRPLTPYGVAKAYGHFIVQSYRGRYGLFACCGIAYNHESPRRPPEFLPRKVARAAVLISRALEHELVLGDLDARRDWGYAPDYVRAMWLMLQQEEARDYVLATGRSSTVRELCALAFARVDLRWEDYVRSDPLLTRGLAELHDLVGDASLAYDLLDWSPSVSFEELVAVLVDAELSAISGDQQALVSGSARL